MTDPRRVCCGHSFAESTMLAIPRGILGVHNNSLFLSTAHWFVKHVRVDFRTDIGIITISVFKFSFASI